MTFQVAQIGNSLRLGSDCRLNTYQLVGRSTLYLGDLVSDPESFNV